MWFTWLLQWQFQVKYPQRCDWFLATELTGWLAFLVICAFNVSITIYETLISIF